MMRIELVKRKEHSQLMAMLSPLIAFSLTLIITGIVFYAIGKDPLVGLFRFFIEPLIDSWSFRELLIKATPLILIACGLSLCYLSNNWNIGAEGQFIMGGVFGSSIPILFPGFENGFTLPLMVVMAMTGGMLWALIPAVLKTRYNTNEILTSLMLVYVASLILDYLVRGPWRDPDGYNFPESRLFPDLALFPNIGNSNFSINILIALAVVAILTFMLAKTRKGFEIRVMGESPRAARFSGFSQSRMTLFTFMVAGGLAGLAGIMEVSVMGQLQPSISPGYGFTAIIVAFLGRLNPVAILVSGTVLGISYIGGEAVQASMGISSKITNVIQGMLLFFVLFADTFIMYKVRISFHSLATGKKKSIALDKAEGDEINV